MTNTMDRSWLIQRLEKPHSFKIAGQAVDNPFSFGGGLRNGGLSEEAMSLLRNVFSFDYMGAAEFEFGAVPEAFQLIAGQAAKGDLVGFTFSIALEDVAENWRASSDRQKNKKPDPDLTGQMRDIYVLCHVDWQEEVEKRIREWASEPYTSKLKESTNLSSTLRPSSEWDGRAQGWLELDNGFMFFTDEEMYRQTAALFALEDPNDVTDDE